MKTLLTFVLGATATGKSTWALTQAEKLGGEILNADSVQVYKYLDIGSAKPTAVEQKRVPHHLYDLVEPSQNFTAGDYRRAALPVIEALAERSPLYLVGGSGFYIQALEKGMYPVKDVSAEVKSEVEEIIAQGQLWAEIQKVDPKTAQKNGPNDLYRNRRALEVSLSEGRPFSQIESEFAEKAKAEALSVDYAIKKVGFKIERAELRKRVEARTQKMLEAGLLDEVKTLIGRGYGDTKALASVGYKECVDHLAGRLKYADLAAAIVTSTMQLAKRQESWFKRDAEIEWR